MATTERRKSISLFFGFSKQEPKTDATPEGFPKLRRKLQKVTKQVDINDTIPTSTNTTITAAPAPDVGGVQTVKLPGDETFLATKYDASRPPPSRDGSKKLATAPVIEEKQTRRESKARSFFRSSSTSRIPNTTRSTSCTRVATVTLAPSTASAARPGSSRGEPAKPGAATTFPTTPTKTTTTERPSTATSTSSGRNNQPLHASTSRPSSYGAMVIDTESRAGVELQALGEVQDKARAQKKAAQSAAQARAFQMMEEKERNSHSHTQKSTPPSASRTKRLTMLPLTLGAQSGGAEKAPARPYPMFHRPYSHTQQQNMSSQEADVRRTLSTAASQSTYTARKSIHSSVPAPVAVSSISMAIAPLSPIPSSAMSDSSSASMSSPTSAAFNLSSASLALTSATSVTQSYSNLPGAANSSCAASSSSPDSALASPFSYALGQRRNRSKFDFDNESTDSNSGSDGRRIVPELSYLSGGSTRSRNSPPTPDSPSSISSVEVQPATTKPRRKVKTPVYAIGQLESESGINVKVNNVVVEATKQVELNLLQSKSSIECIAEEYRALLASRNSQSTVDNKSEVNVRVDSRPTSSGMRTNALQAQRKFMLSPGPKNNSMGVYNADARLSSPLLPAAIFQDWPSSSLPLSSPSPSPGPRATININSPAPPPPLPPLRTRSSMMGINHCGNTTSIANNIYDKFTTPPPAQPSPPTQQTDNLGLQICVDLLTRELSSAVVRRSSPAAATAASQRAATRRHLQQSNGHGATISSPLSSMAPPMPSPADNTSSALQILVMIEAYERLRDQLVSDAQAKARASKRLTKSSASEVSEIEAMFGLWLKALYRIHDSLTSEENNDDDYTDDNDELDNTSDSDYDSAAEGI